MFIPPGLLLLFAEQDHKVAGNNLFLYLFWKGSLNIWKSSPSK